jgi:hypothetical protein
MTVSLPFVKLTVDEGRAMNTLFTVVVFAFVLAVLAVVAYALFEVSPFARHADQFRDPRTGKRRWDSPHLD